MNSFLNRFGRLCDLLFWLFIFAVCYIVACSCTTFRKAERKFATTVYDTIQVTVPRDSAVVSLRTDTTRVQIVERQGRATVRIIRDPQRTVVSAVCDTVRVERVVEKQVWGVDPKFQRQADEAADKIRAWRYRFWGLFCLFMAAVALYVFVYHLRLIITRR